MAGMKSQLKHLKLILVLAGSASLVACSVFSSLPIPPTAKPRATRTPPPVGYPVPLRGDIGIRKVFEAGPGFVRLDVNPLTGDLYYMNTQGDIYLLSARPGDESDSKLAYTHAEIGGAPYTLGMAFGPDGALYVMGNESEGSTNRCVIRKGVMDGNARKWSTLASTEFYPKSDTQYDHLCNGIVVSPDGKYVYFNSGSRTEHGEVQDAKGQFPDTREAPLTSAIFRVPADAQDRVLPNDEAALKEKGYLFADGVRNAFDLAFAANGDLFGIDNGPDADLPDELNWLREGRHYGFPWRFGSYDNPQRSPDYDPGQDKRLHDDFVAVKEGMYHNDPDFPKPPANFTDPVANVGPDADQYRAEEGSQRDASERGEKIYTFTPHRSPLGLAFDKDTRLSGDLKGSLLALSWGAAGGTLTDRGQDLLLVKLTKKDDNYEAQTTQLIRGFEQPIDSVLIDDKLYVLDFGGKGAIWEVSLP
jgi:glucose/arabinose dehydrogenase